MAHNQSFLFHYQGTKTSKYINKQGNKQNYQHIARGKGEEFYDLISNTYAGADMDFNAISKNWVVGGLNLEEIRTAICKDINYTLTEAESEFIANQVYAKNAQAIPRVMLLNKVNSKNIEKTASNKQYRHKYAGIMWQVQAMVGDDGKEGLYLVRIEEEKSKDA
jgi:hypothetical protein